MGIGFVIGRAGTGKTHHCLQAISRDLAADPLGPPIYWIVPRQATFSTERLLLENFGPFSRCRVVSFDTLGVEVLGATGGSAAGQISAQGRQMIIGLLLRQLADRLVYFKSSARRVGLASELDATFAEIERSGKTFDDLADADTETLLTKSRELQLIYAEYQRFLGPDRLDTFGRLQHVLKSMAASPQFREATVYIDGMNQFTLHERQMIVGLAKACHQVTVTLLMDPASPLLGNIDQMPDEMRLLFKPERAYRQLVLDLRAEGITPAPPVKLKAARRFNSPILARLEQFLFDRSAAKRDADGSIQRIEAPDRVAEVDAVARTIRQLQMKGYRLREILVLVRNLEDYQPLVAASFREHGLPYFVDARRSAMHHPLLQWVRAVFAIARRDWPHESVMELLKSGLASVSLDDADEVENYVLLHGVDGKAWEQSEPWPWEKKLVREDEQELPTWEVKPADADAIRRRVTDRLAPFLHVLQHQKQLTFRQICSELFKVFEAFGVRQTMADWIAKATAAGELEAAAEHQQTWANVVELFDEMVALLGDHEVTLDDFVQTLDSGLEAFDFALTPPTLDQVTVGQVDRSRVSNARACIVLGLSEGLFPRVSSEPSVLNDNDRILLRRRSIDLDDDTARLLLDERLLGYIAFTRASEKLILTRPTNDDADKELGPSPFWTRFDQLFEDMPTSAAPCYAHDKPECIATPRQFVTGLMKWARRVGEAERPDDATWANLYQAMAGYTPGADSITTLRRLAWRALSYTNTAELSPQTATKLFPSPLSATVSQIETFAACPFKHFLRHGLQLQDREVRDFTWADMGMAYHQILENIVQDMLQSKRKWQDLSEAEAQAKIKATADAVAKELREEIMLSNARNKYLMSRIERTLAQVLSSQRTLADRQALKPARVGVGFGRDKDLLQPPLIQTPAGKTVRLHGRIDRVDMVEDRKMLAVIDYRSGSGQLNLGEVYHGLALQLLAYMLVIRENQREPKFTPVAAFYQSVARSLRAVDHPDDCADPESEEFRLRVKPRGIFDQDLLTSFDSKVQAGESSLAVNAYLTVKGEFGRRDYADNADPGEINLLLDHVKAMIAKLADDLMGGKVTIAPYRLGDVSPCPRCSYKSICRFDPGINRYHVVQPMKKSQVLDLLAGKEVTDE
jgi:ATP-dependent helicase/nuclease subunit B